MTTLKRFAVVSHGVPQFDHRADAELLAQGLRGGSPSQEFEVYERCGEEERRAQVEEWRNAAIIEQLQAHAETWRAAARAADGHAKELADRFASPIPMRLVCPRCCALHIDEGEFATKPHHTHACQSCGEVWRPAIVPTVGVRFLPGFKNGDGS